MTEGVKGRIVKTIRPTHRPRLLVGANSEVPARAVSSPIPAPPPAIVMPPDIVGQLDPRLANKPLGLTNEDVHVLRGRANDHAKNDQTHATNGDIAAAEQIRQSAHEGACSCECQQVTENHPDPSINTTELAVNGWWNTTEEVYWDLRCGPQECQS